MHLQQEKKSKEILKIISSKRKLIQISINIEDMKNKPWS